MYTKAIVISFLASLASADMSVFSDTSCSTLVATYTMDQVYGNCITLPQEVNSFSFTSEEDLCGDGVTWDQFGLYKTNCAGENGVGGGCGSDKGCQATQNDQDKGIPATFVNGYQAGFPGPP